SPFSYGLDSTNVNQILAGGHSNSPNSTPFSILLHFPIKLQLFRQFQKKNLLPSAFPHFYPFFLSAKGTLFFLRSFKKMPQKIKTYFSLEQTSASSLRLLQKSVFLFLIRLGRPSV